MSTINREDALDAVYERIRQIGYEHNASVLSIRQVIRDLPPAQPEQQRLSDWKEDFKGYINAIAIDLSRDDYYAIMEYIDEVPSAQPDLDEWCTDCKEYDSERHCCPKYNRVIRDAVEEAKEDDWIPCSERMPDEDYWTGAGTQHSAEVLMTVYSVADEKAIIDFGHTVDGKWYSDRTDCYVPNWWKVLAWMPLPKTWEGEKDENTKMANQAEMQRP